VLVALAGGAAWWMARRGSAPTAVDVVSAVRRARFQSTVSASGEIVATRYADIGSSVMGKIVSLPVAEGQRVKAGQLLARIDPVQAQSDATGATAFLQALEAEERGAAQQVKAAESDVAAADARARDAGQQLVRAQDLRQSGLIAVADFDTARTAADATTAQLASARAAVDRARHALDAASRKVAQAKAQLMRASDVLSKTAVVSPIDGIVSRLQVREGEMVVVGIQNQPGTTLMTISDLSAVNAEVKVAEADVLRLALDQPASVAMEAIPGTTFPGRVVEIGASALPLTGTGAAAREFKVVVRLDSPDARLRPGLTCDAEIVTSDRRDVVTVPLQSAVIRPVAGQGDKTGVFVVSDGRVRFTPVATGVIGGLDIEVSGLEPGTLVVSGPYQVLRDLTDGAPVRVNAGAAR
jgi:HlyD family secretion protein